MSVHKMIDQASPVLESHWTMTPLTLMPHPAVNIIVRSRLSMTNRMVAQFRKQENPITNVKI